MQLERYLLKHFSNPPQKVYEIARPESAKFTGKVKILHDGIHAFYEVPEIILSDNVLVTDKFVILEPKQSIPANGKLVDVLDVIFERDTPDETLAEPTQGMMLFPVYKLEE